MRLVPVSYARTAIGEQDFADINTMIDSAIKLVTYPLEALLMTKFSRGEYKDLYRVDNKSPVLCQEMVKLALSRGLVDTVVPMVITTSDTMEGLATADPSTVTPLVDAVNGIVTIPSLLPTCWLQIEYTAGIVGDDVEYDSDYVPDWLKDAAVVYVATVYQRLVADKNRDMTKAQKESVALTKLPHEVVSALQTRIRWYPDAYQPYITQ